MHILFVSTLVSLLFITIIPIYIDCKNTIFSLYLLALQKLHAGWLSTLADILVDI